MLIAGVLIAGGFVGLTTLIVRGQRGARIALIVFAMAWLLLIGVGGAIATWGWFATDHVVCRYNENLLQVSPLALFLLVLLPKASGGGRRLAFVVSAIIAGLSILGLALKASPFFFQVNGDMISLCLPIHLALCWSMWRLWKMPPKPRTESLDRKRGPADSADFRSSRRRTRAATQ